MTVKEIRDKYGKTVLNSSNQHDPRKYVLQSARNFVITFDGWHSRYRNGYHLNVGGYMYPSYITLSAKNTGDIGIAHGDTIDAYAAPSDFENVYYDHRGDVYLTLNFDDCVIKICVDPGWGSSFALSTQEEKDAEFEKYKEDPYGTVKEIVFFPSDELKARLESQKKEEINGEIFALLDMTPSEITSKYGELTETYFENVRSYIMHTPDRLDGVNLVYSQSQPSENELPQEIVINEYFDRSFLGMHIGEHVTALVRGKTITRVWYDEDIGCCLSFEEDGYTVTVITGGEGCTGEIGSAEWAKSFKEKPLGYIRAIKAEKQPE